MAPPTTSTRPGRPELRPGDQRISETHCPECGAAWPDGQTCVDAFHTLGFWEMDGGLLDVHHLMVLCYHLQHPSLYSPEGLASAMRLLAEFVDGGVTPQAVRRRNAKSLDSGARRHKIKGTPASHGAYAHPVAWSMTVADVVAAGMDRYYDSIRAWARSVLESLGEAGNLP